jgi:hypothetical protein
MSTLKTAGARATRKSGVTPISKLARAIPAVPSGATIDPVLRHELISEAAYFRAERRGFADGGEFDDWLAAEREVDARLAGRAADDEPVAQADEEDQAR